MPVGATLGAVELGVGIYNAHKQASTAKDISQNQQATANANAQRIQQSGQQANAYAQQWQQAANQGAAPYISLGQGALTQLGGRLGVKPTASPPQPWQPVNLNGNSYGSMFGGGQAQPQMDMVTLRAPNGQTKQVPRADAQKYVQAGATVVG